MIDKSIRQHYQEGEKVNYITEGIKKLVPTNEQGKLDVGQLAKNVATNKLTAAATKKLAGTGILSSLGPIGMLIAYMLAKKGVKYAKGKIKVPKDIRQALTQGFTGLGVGSPQEQKELRQLEKRRANMLKRKEEGKGYSDKNLDIVTRAIAEAKGLDINNPNEMKNIDKDISKLYTKTEAPPVIPKTPEVKIPHLLGEDPVEDSITERPKDLPEHLTWIPPGKDTVEDTITPPVWNPGIAAQEEAEKQAAFDRAVAENKAKAAAEAAAARVWTPPVRHHTGGNGGNGGGGGGQAAADAAGGSSYSSPFAYGGRIDKALGGRSRDI